jgi:hypothetical protein
MFDDKGPLKVRDPVDSNNPYIGRIDANDVPPPRDVSSLAARICHMEGRAFGKDDIGWQTYSTELFKTISSPEAFDLAEHLSLLSADRPGSGPQDPVIVKSR